MFSNLFLTTSSILLYLHVSLYKKLICPYILGKSFFTIAAIVSLLFILFLLIKSLSSLLNIISFSNKIDVVYPSLNISFLTTFDISLFSPSVIFKCCNVVINFPYLIIFCESQIAFSIFASVHPKLLRISSFVEEPPLSLINLINLSSLDVISVFISLYISNVLPLPTLNSSP